MRLRKPRVDQLARKMADCLEKLEGVELSGDRQSIEFQFTEAILDDLAAEDELEEEAHKLLTLHLRGKPRDSVNYAEVFKKAKAELAKKKGIVLEDAGGRGGDKERLRRLPQARVQSIVRDAMERLDEEGLVAFKGRVTTARTELERVVIGDLKIEDEIEEEARKFILRMKNPPPEGSAQFQAMLLKKKEELAGRRGYAL